VEPDAELTPYQLTVTLANPELELSLDVATVRARTFKWTPITNSEGRTMFTVTNARLKCMSGALCPDTAFRLDATLVCNRKNGFRFRSVRDVEDAAVRVAADKSCQIDFSSSKLSVTTGGRAVLDLNGGYTSQPSGVHGEMRFIYKSATQQG
jgi:hypothetical protein